MSSSQKTAWWRAATGSSQQHNALASTSRIPASTGNSRTFKSFAGIGGLMDSKGLADASLEKTTPQGIYTRINSTVKRTSKAHPYGPSLHWASEKFPCSVCGSKMLCLCPSCVNHKTRFFDKREFQRAKELLKKKFTHEIEKILAPEISVEEALHSTRESIECMKQLIIDKKKAIKRKKAVLSVVRSRSDRYRKTIEELKDRCRTHEKVLSGSRSEWKAFRDACQDEVQKMVKFNARYYFKIFPIEKVLKPEPADDHEKHRQEIAEAIAEACQEENNAPAVEKAWAILAPKEYGAAAASFYSICKCGSPDYTQYGILRDWLKIGIPTVSSARALQNMYAALVYIIQLVNLLTVHFNICIPGQISFQEFSLCRKWVEGLFDTDIFKLNHAVVLLCLSLGVEPNFIEPHNPFVNLLFLSNIVNDPDSVQKPSHHALTDQLAAVLNGDLRKICWAERDRPEEGDWCIVRDNFCYSDNFYDETYNDSTRLRPVASISDLDEF